MINTMKNLIAILITVFTTNISSSQNNVEFKFDKVSVKFITTINNNNYHQKIEIINNFDSDIYIPKIISNEINFFNLGNKLYLYCGISFSLLGEPKMYNDVNLIKVEKGKNYVYELDIPKTKDVEIICLGFEYLKNFKSDANNIHNKAGNFCRIRKLSYRTKYKYYHR